MKTDKKSEFENNNNKHESGCCGEHSHGGHNHKEHSHDGCCGGHNHGGHNHKEHSHDGCCGEHNHGGHNHNEHSHAGCCGEHNHGGHNHKEHSHDGCCGEHNHGGHNHGGHNHFGTVHGHFDPAQSPLESYLLKLLKAANYLPLAQFVMKSEKSSHFVSTALSPVFIISKDDDIDKIKATGAALRILENFGYLTLDYDIPLDNYSYDEYKNSPVYADFVLMMKEAASRDDFVYDTADINFGSIALTDEGEMAVAKL